ncbi:hypothetical protein M2480_002053 [Parabacteroides sp. PFB2-12]|uniref:SH3 beta-barrel fold-containing protein n=1 Tax=unclassified Parabacteroides TaxID=2649774 RepID=UPI00247667FE|nr:MULTISPECIES: SH3 beta-barrel fold-containing protein [unclassified Parabacteroides]MDH6342921.1 hypothetical protein [Parabacteroides sp. PM6-13]MDH6391064.1 hypothetical protein [Parabacteroides sp. PFB2-12]
MSTSKRNELKGIMAMAWRLFRVTGEAFADCLRKAWANFKLAAAMRTGIVKFYYQKVNGEVRQAFGTLSDKYINVEVKGSQRAKNDLLFTYFDTEKQAFRSFKRFNIQAI